MRKSVTVQVTCVAGGEVLADVMVGLAQVKRTINAIHFEQAADIRLRAYVDQERVIDSASDCDDMDFNPVVCDIPLDVGQTFKVGFQSDGVTNTAQYITVDYTEE